MILSTSTVASNGGSLPDNNWPAAWTAEDADADATSPEVVCEAALRYVDAGLSVIPIDAYSGDKSPDQRRVPSWKIYQLRPPREDEIRRWCDYGGPFGLAVLGGAVSGGQAGCGLEIIDFDTIDLAEPWLTAVGKRAPGLIERLAMVLSPRPGLHVYYRCRVFKGCGKLACAPAVNAAGQLLRDKCGRLQKTTLIERKGMGGYCVCPPSPRRCHPRNQLYQLLEGSPDLTQVPIISVEEREIVLEEARRFNRWIEPEAVPSTRSSIRVVRDDGGRPGDDFNQRARWEDILTPHGWLLVGRRGDIEDWRRPGKDSGLSVTVNYADSGLMYVFSSNAAPFDNERAYDKFAAFALLEHGGDFRKAASALQQQGYGRQMMQAGKRVGIDVFTTVLCPR